MTTEQARIQDIRSNLVRATFMVRLIAITYCLVSVLLVDGNVVVAITLVWLMVTTQLGLHHERIRRFVVRHPSLAFVDLLPITVAPLLVGPDSALGLATLMSALLIGVLFPLRTAVPLLVLLVTVHLMSAQVLRLHVAPGELVGTFQTPVALVCIAGLGYAVRRLAEQRGQAEEERALAVQAAAAAQERLRLARDLHDTVAKSVQGVALVAAAIPVWMTRDPAIARRHADTVAAGAQEAVVAARRLLTSLRLDDPERPLADVVDELAHRWESEFDRTVVRDLDDLPDLAPGHRHELVLAVSEALENIQRHAPDAATTLTARSTPDTVVVTIADDGPGFDEQREHEANTEGRFGLVGIRERMRHVGGEAVIRSAVGLGTEVTLTIPRESRPTTSTTVAVAGRPGAVMTRWRLLVHGSGSEV